jgi:hypothetical protein
MTRSTSSGTVSSAETAIYSPLLALFQQCRDARYDDCIHDTLEVILNVELSDHSWLQASLPVSVGGLGVRTASQIVLPA